MTFRWIWAAVWLGSLLLPAFNAGSNVEQKETREFPPALAQARQMIVVTTPNWDAVDGVLQPVINNIHTPNYLLPATLGGLYLPAKMPKINGR